MVAGDWIKPAIDDLRSLKVEHRNYQLTKRRIASACLAMLPGELMVLVGPSRVGKTRCIRDALNIPAQNFPEADERMRVVVVEAANDATSGQFSTKDFAMSCLRSIHHPIYGACSDRDPWEQQRSDLLDRTPERRLWSSFEVALRLRKIEYLVIDEAHHVLYVPGGPPAAARILDSWKCLGNSTGVKIVLAGSYSLLSLIGLAPHLLGRHQPVEFPRYRVDDRRDVESWEQILRQFSGLIRCADGNTLSAWNRLLFDGSQGRIGGLSRWLRSALALMLAEHRSFLDEEILRATRLPVMHEAAILSEIVQGERDLARHSDQHNHGVISEYSVETSVRSRNKSSPFRSKSRRNPVDGRA